MSVKINRIELNQRNDNPSLAVFMFVGNQDPVLLLNEAVEEYVEENEYYEFIDANMDNPWTRVILKDIEGFQQNEIDVEGRKFHLYKLHIENNIEVAYLVYADDKDNRPNPIMDLAVIQFANGRVYNEYIDSDVSDLWSRLVIIGVNDIPQEDFKDQRL